ncbi:MAG: hypothetical protein E7265_02805 [Lachnospiraceae bacterium]|nr:hypothetical protein [Lachnospiraceae bacterium]
MKLFSIKNITKVVVLSIAIISAVTLHSDKALAKGKYTVKVSTKPCDKSYSKLKTYNKSTKHYYMLKSYLEKLQKNGGGTLTLNKGTYNIPCTLYVPSNVTIKLKTGVTLKKTAKTGTKKLAATKTMFELVSPAKAKKKNSIKKYYGSKNISITGGKTSTINMNNIDGGVGIAAGHNTNLSITGIKFKNIKGGSFITVAASKKVVIDKCSFSGYKVGKDAGSKYAIRLEVPDSTTKMFAYKWSKADKTCNNNISITNNTFTKLPSGVGTEKYTNSKYQKGIILTGNTFSNLSEHGVRMLNWDGAQVSSNIFDGIGAGSEAFYGIYAGGVINPVITSNNFNNVAVPIKIAAATNVGAGKGYPASYNTIPASSVTGFENNVVANATKYYVIFQPSVSASSAKRLAYYMDYVTKDYVIKPGSTPYHDYYTDNAWYNEYTRDYYVFRSYFEQLERVGGGTLTVETGDYSITNTLYVPSNVTVNFQHGVNIRKGTYTGLSETVLAPSISLFQFVPPSLSATPGAVGGYNGSHDIQFIGQGTVNMDLLFYTNATAIVMGHNRNILVQGINFHNYLGHHFIELDASQNVTIQGCTFSGSSFTSSANSGKEAINIDIPDKNTGGFTQIWTNYDRTANDTIIIKNNIFLNTLRAIGTHKYSVSAVDNVTQIYHTNVQILDNTINNTNSYAIRSMNWKDCIIKGNTIKNVNSGKTVAILMSGSVNPTITGNVIDTALRPITLNPAHNPESDKPDKFYPASPTILDSNEATGINISAMLNNTLIDMTGSNQLFYYMEEGGKATKFKYDSSNIITTKPTPSPEPTTEPTTEPTKEPDTNVTPEPEATREPTASSEPLMTPEPSALPTPSPEPESSEEPYPGAE